MGEKGPYFLCRCKVPRPTVLCHHHLTQDSELFKTCLPTTPVIRIPISSPQNSSASSKGQKDRPALLSLSGLSHQTLLHSRFCQRARPRTNPGLPMVLFSWFTGSGLVAHPESSSSSFGLLFRNCRWPQSRF